MCLPLSVFFLFLEHLLTSTSLHIPSLFSVSGGRPSFGARHSSALSSHLTSIGPRTTHRELYYLRALSLLSCFVCSPHVPDMFPSRLTVVRLLLFLRGGREERVEVAVSGQREAAGFPSLGCHRNQPLHRHGQRDIPLRGKSVDGSGRHRPPASRAGLSEDGVLCGIEKTQDTEWIKEISENHLYIKYMYEKKYCTYPVSNTFTLDMMPGTRSFILKYRNQSINPTVN